MNVTVRHVADPKRPESPYGTIVVEVDGKPIKMPDIGHEKIISVKKVVPNIRDEFSRP